MQLRFSERPARHRRWPKTSVSASASRHRYTRDARNLKRRYGPWCILEGSGCSPRLESERLHRTATFGGTAGGTSLSSFRSGQLSLFFVVCLFTIDQRKGNCTRFISPRSVSPDKKAPYIHIVCHHTEALSPVASAQQAPSLLRRSAARRPGPSAIPTVTTRVLLVGLGG